MNYSTSEMLITVFVFLFAAVVAKPLSLVSKVPYPILLMLVGFFLHLSQQWLGLPLQWLTSKEIAHDVILLLLLPTLVFETASNLNIAKLQANRLAIFTLALPGVLISSLVVAVFITIFTPLDWQIGLLFGAILSATDPSAVISAFRQLGAPKDLIMLIEGESLFNDATAITLTKILVISFALVSSPWMTLWNSSSLFLITLGGGIACGWLFARLMIIVLYKIPNDPFIDVSLSLVLAFGSYLFAEKILNASGIVATTVAGITLVSHAPLAISHKSLQYFNNFWSYLSFIATASIFLIVGLWIDLPLIADNVFISLIVLAGLWLSRALIAYILLPHIGRLQRQAQVIPMAYRHLVFVGGMRGAVTMALAMGLVSLLADETILSVAISVVFLTTFLQGMIITPLANHLGLKNNDINDTITCTELALSTLHHSRNALQPLLNSTFAQTGAPQALEQQLSAMIAIEEKQLRHWSNVEMGPVALWQRLMLRCASIEISYLYQLFDNGLITTEVFEFLKNAIDEQMEAVRHQYMRPRFSLFPKRFSSVLQQIRGYFKRSSEKLISLEYEVAWARLISCNHVLDELQTLSEEEKLSLKVTEDVAKVWQGWLESCEIKIAKIEEQQPIIAATVQRTLLKNYMQTAQSEHLQQYVQQHLISEEDVEQIKHLLKVLENDLGKDH